ncbi:type II toxin-antitoxin system YafQ family toxin [Actinomyces faecalis]|uniref:type II toxin-antitoxin system RelE/ParE family toxin n=1 Tax=Actinomyces faecalis TaxID=2722820 RepID=UPI0015541752|nr:type II toxin-antitoxin system YafQ family toxin [Actinomyces faecalis]
MVLAPEPTPRFRRDVKALRKKHVDLAPLREVIDLIVADTDQARDELVRHHGMHRLRGQWEASNECHVANAGDWLLIWTTTQTQAILQRTGGHDDLFGH